jgi:putative AlgH/UPF0301 family transcriptional regulator
MQQSLPWSLFFCIFFAYRVDSFFDSVAPIKIQKCSLMSGSVLLSRPSRPQFVHESLLVYQHDELSTFAVTLDNPSLFTMGELTHNMGVFSGNTLFDGGTDGEGTATVFHEFDLGGYSKKIGNGLFVGGFKEARELVDRFGARPKDFKFICNGKHWQTQELLKEINNGFWEVCQAPPKIILRGATSSSDFSKGRGFIWEILHHELQS